MKIFITGIITLLLTTVLMAESSQFMPLKKIIEKPESFNLKVIQTSGKINIDFENQELSVSFCETAPSKIKRGIWIDTSKINLKKFGSLSHVNAKVKGVFKAKEKGHMGLYSGTLVLEDLEILRSDSKEICK